jgi:hypothetical protein
MPTFKHSGDLGDIIYSLPTVRALGGGTLLLDIMGGPDEPLVRQTCIGGRTKFGRPGYDTVRPLLVQQPYVQDVRVWQGEPVDHNLDRFRRQAFADNRLNLAACHLREFGQPDTLADVPWLTVREPPIKLHRPLMINRTVRFHSKYHWWALNIASLAPQSIFLGLEKEHEVFQYTFDCQIDRHAAADALEIARVLVGAQGLIGNQSFVMALAIALGVPFVQEVYDYTPNCKFARPNGKYI